MLMSQSDFGERTLTFTLFTAKDRLWHQLTAAGVFKGDLSSLILSYHQTWVQLSSSPIWYLERDALKWSVKLNCPSLWKGVPPLDIAQEEPVLVDLSVTGLSHRLNNSNGLLLLSLGLNINLSRMNYRLYQIRSSNARQLGQSVHYSA